MKKMRFLKIIETDKQYYLEACESEDFLLNSEILENGSNKKSDKKIEEWIDKAKDMIEKHGCDYVAYLYLNTRDKYDDAEQPAPWMKNLGCHILTLTDLKLIWRGLDNSLKKLDIETDTYEYEDDGFMVDIVTDYENYKYEAYIYHRRCGVKEFIIASSFSETTKKTFTDDVSNELKKGKYIKTYKKDYMK